MTDNKIDRFSTDKEVLFSAGSYAVAVCVARDPLLEEDLLFYGIYNTVTGVREAEVRKVRNAETICAYLASPPVQATENPDQLPLVLN